jgi:hypothetical protein
VSNGIFVERTRIIEAKGNNPKRIAVTFLFLFDIEPIVVSLGPRNHTIVPTPARIDGVGVLPEIASKLLPDVDLDKLDAGTAFYTVIEDAFALPVTKAAVMNRAEEMWQTMWTNRADDLHKDQYQFSGTVRSVTPGPRP